MILEAESTLYYTALSAQRLRCNDNDHDITVGRESGGQDQYKYSLSLLKLRTF